jgi:hypothetical protein
LLRPLVKHKQASVLINQKVYSILRDKNNHLYNFG